MALTLYTAVSTFEFIRRPVESPGYDDMQLRAHRPQSTPLSQTVHQNTKGDAHSIINNIDKQR
jgi:hypothetical protein